MNADWIERATVLLREWCHWRGRPADDIEAADVPRLVRELLAGAADASKLDTPGLPAIFGECCLPAVNRYNLSRPWHDGGRIYATDGRILVWCDATPELARRYAADPAGRYPACDDVIASQAPWQDTPHPIPDVGDGLATCNECGGDGLCHCYRCQASHLCGWCDGTGMMDVREPVGIGDWHFNTHYLARLRRHGVELLSLSTLPAVAPGQSLESKGAARFRGPGFDGLLMPMQAPVSEQRPVGPTQTQAIAQSG